MVWLCLLYTSHLGGVAVGHVADGVGHRGPQRVRLSQVFAIELLTVPGLPGSEGGHGGLRRSGRPERSGVLWRILGKDGPSGGPGAQPRQPRGLRLRHPGVHPCLLYTSILDHGVGSLEKVHVVNGRTVDVDMGQETAYVYMAGS